jgi:hypothetical protein
MSAVTVVPPPPLDGKRLVLVLAEDRVGHYPEFRAFFVRTFDLNRVGLASPGYLRAASGLDYALIFVGRSGEPFPVGAEISAIVDALEPLDEGVVDRDLWEILRWMIAGVGGTWSVADLDATGRLYRVPAVADSLD